VAPGAGQLILLLRQDTKESLFYCPSCGTAWKEHPGDSLDSLDPLEELAPFGVRLPTEEEAQSLEIGTLEKIPYEDWDSDLDEVLGVATWSEVRRLREEIEELVAYPKYECRVAKSAATLKSKLVELDAEGDTLPGARAWAVVYEALGDLENAVAFWQRHLAYVEKLYAMGKVNSGGIGARDLAQACEQLALTLWDANRNDQAVAMYTRFRDIAKNAELSLFDEQCEKTLLEMLTDTLPTASS